MLNVYQIEKERDVVVFVDVKGFMANGIKDAC
jgi:hypothetical protein